MSRLIARRLAWLVLEICWHWPDHPPSFPGWLYRLGNRLFAYGWRVYG